MKKRQNDNVGHSFSPICTTVVESIYMYGMWSDELYPLATVSGQQKLAHHCKRRRDGAVDPTATAATTIAEVPAVADDIVRLAIAKAIVGRGTTVRTKSHACGSR